MNSSLKLKIGLVIFLLFFSGLALTPSFYHDLPDWWKKYMAPAGLKLGLDLQGGMHIVLQVDLEKAAENSLDLAASDFKAALASNNINAVRMDTRITSYNVCYTKLLRGGSHVFFPPVGKGVIERWRQRQTGEKEEKND